MLYGICIFILTTMANLTEILCRILCEEQTRIIKPPTKKLLKGLEEYFAEAGPFCAITLDDLVRLAELVYQHYMCNAAYEAALGYGDRDPAVYGSPSEHNITDRTQTPSDKESQSLLQSGPMKKCTTRKANAAEVHNFSQGDQTLATTINFLRITFWYLEMCAVAAEGDIGRIFEIIKVCQSFSVIRPRHLYFSLYSYCAFLSGVRGQPTMEMNFLN